jgi:hypothetical protein
MTMNRTTKTHVTGMPVRFHLLDGTGHIDTKVDGILIGIDYAEHEKACVARLCGRKHMANLKRSERKRAQRLAAHKKRRK